MSASGAWSLALSGRNGGRDSEKALALSGGREESMASQTRTETVATAVVHIQPPAAQSPVREESPPGRQPKQVCWVEGTVDNESLGRRSSKVCCVYHKPRAFAESSSESSSDSSSSDGEGEGSEGPASSPGVKQRPQKKCAHRHRSQCRDDGNARKDGGENAGGR